MVRRSRARRVVFVVVGSSCSMSLMACSLLTSFDALSGSTDQSVVRDGSHPAIGEGGAVVSTDASADTGDPFVVYLPAAGKYQYVQNATAYADASDFDAAATDFGFDILTVVPTFGQPSVVRRAQAVAMPAVVGYTDGGAGACWTLALQVLPNGGGGAHAEDETFCAREGGQLDPGIRSTVNYQTWNLPLFGSQSTTAVVDCSASNAYVVHGMKPGDSFMHSCTGTAAQTKGTYSSQGPYVYVGLEAVTVDGVSEDVFHTLRTRAVIGATSGYEVTDFYLSARDGLPLRIHRFTHIETPVTTPGINKAIYDEHGSDWILSSHVPMQ